jgi:hypothetical protein
MILTRSHDNSPTRDPLADAYLEAMARALANARDGGCTCRPEAVLDMRRDVNQVRLLHDRDCPRLAQAQGGRD